MMGTHPAIIADVNRMPAGGGRGGTGAVDTGPAVKGSAHKQRQRWQRGGLLLDPPPGSCRQLPLLPGSRRAAAPAAWLQRALRALRAHAPAAVTAGVPQARHTAGGVPSSPGSAQRTVAPAVGGEAEAGGAQHVFVLPTHAALDQLRQARGRCWTEVLAVLGSH